MADGLLQTMVPVPRQSPVLGPELDHYWLVQRMAKTTGVDLVKAWDAGLLTSEDWAGLVHRCGGCAWTGGCDRFLDDRARSETPDLPAPCLNRSRFAEIKAQLQELDA